MINLRWRIRHGRIPRNLSARLAVPRDQQDGSPQQPRQQTTPRSTPDDLLLINIHHATGRPGFFNISVQHPRNVQPTIVIFTVVEQTLLLAVKCRRVVPAAPRQGQDAMETSPPAGGATAGAATASSAPHRVMMKTLKPLQASRGVEYGGQHQHTAQNTRTQTHQSRRSRQGTTSNSPNPNPNHHRLQPSLIGAPAALHPQWPSGQPGPGVAVGHPHQIPHHPVMYYHMMPY